MKGTRLAVARRRLREDEEESGGPLYNEKPTYIIQGSDYNKLLQDIWKVVKDEGGMQDSKWTEWAAKKVMDNLSKFREITGQSMTNSQKVKHLLESVRTHTRATTTLEFRGTKKIVTIAIPKPPAEESTQQPQQGRNILEEDNNEEENQSEEEQELQLGQPSYEENIEDQAEISLEGISRDIIELTNTMESNLEQTRALLDNYDDTDPNSQHAEYRQDFIQTLITATENMSQLGEATRKLDSATRAHVQAYATDIKNSMKSALKKRMKEYEQEMEERMEQKLLSTLRVHIQSMEAQANKRIQEKLEEQGDKEIERQKNEIDSFKDSILIQMETERNEMDEQWKEQFQEERQSTPFPLPYHPPGAPQFSGPFDTHTTAAEGLRQVAQGIRHTNAPSSPGRAAKLSDFDKSDTYVYEGNKYFLKPKRLLDSIDSLPTIQDRDDILYVYTAIRTVASPCGILLTTPDTIPMYSQHRYPTTFGIRSDAERNDNINFETGGQTLDQLYSTMSTALYTLLKEVIAEDYYEGRHILQNAARHQEGYQALYMLLHSCLPRLNRMATAVTPPMWKDGEDLSKFVSKTRAYMEFMETDKFDEEKAILHIITQVPEREYPGVNNAHAKFQHYVDQRNAYDSQYGNVAGHLKPMAPQIPGELRLVYLGYTINTSPVTSTTRRMIAEEIERLQPYTHIEEPTIHLARRTGSQALCKVCGTYGHEGEKHGCDNMAMVQNCMRFRAQCKRNNDNDIITKIVEKHKHFNEEKLKEAEERKKKGITPKANTKNRGNSNRGNSRSRDSRDRYTRTTDADYGDEDSESVYTEDSWDTTTTIEED